MDQFFAKRRGPKQDAIIAPICTQHIERETLAEQQFVESAIVLGVP
jgi:hypothetical protein